ncbi:uncharacterized protein LOC107369935 [Tetranychus urticae]|uniref:Uncharacterized protein n=1 Tax=Tetranychus urticae TaxID=32264 RepID=T1L3V7_TETUR|nr:uncharacterized protein LOC107369935 [Tetranychus urticae]
MSTGVKHGKNLTMPRHVDLHSSSNPNQVMHANNGEFQDKPRLAICICQLRQPIKVPCKLKHMAVIDGKMHGCVSYEAYYEDKTENLELNKDNYPILEPVPGVPFAADLRKDAAKDKIKRDWQCPYCGYCSTKYIINRHINSRKDEKNDGKFVRPSCTARREAEPFADDFAEWPQALRKPVKLNNKYRKYAKM